MREVKQGQEGSNSQVSEEAQNGNKESVSSEPRTIPDWRGGLHCKKKKLKKGLCLSKNTKTFF